MSKFLLSIGFQCHQQKDENQQWMLEQTTKTQYATNQTTPNVKLDIHNMEGMKL